MVKFKYYFSFFSQQPSSSSSAPQHGANKQSSKIIYDMLFRRKHDGAVIENYKFYYAGASTDHNSIHLDGTT
jgi:hypothetical protein